MTDDGKERLENEVKRLENEFVERVEGIFVMLNDMHQHTANVAETANFMAGIKSAIEDLSRYSVRLYEDIRGLKSIASENGLRIKHIEENMEFMRKIVNALHPQENRIGGREIQH